MSSTKRSPKKKASTGVAKPQPIIPTPSITLIAAAPKSGKSYLIRYIVSSMCETGHFSYGIVFSTTGKFNGDYDYIPECYVHAEYSDEKISAVMRHQKQTGSRPMFIIFDDMTSQVKMDSKVFTRFIQAYRHYNCSIIFATHMIAKVSTLFRECTTTAIIFRQRTKRTYDALHENFFGDIPRDQLEEFVKKYTALPFQYLMVCVGAGEYQSGMAPANYPFRRLNY